LVERSGSKGNPVKSGKSGGDGRKVGDGQEGHVAKMQNIWARQMRLKTSGGGTKKQQRDRCRLLATNPH